MVHIVLCTSTTEKKEKNTSETSIFWSNLALVVKQQKPDLIQKTKNKNTNCVHWCFWCADVGFVSRVHWWCLKIHYFLQVLSFFFCSCFLNPFFLMLAFGFVGFAFLVFLFTSSCCCLIIKVAMLWLLFVFLWASLVLLCVIFWIVFFGGAFVFLGGFKGQVRWPKASLFVLFCFWLVLCFVFFWVLFCLLFWHLFFWEGFQGQVRLPEGPPHLAINPPYLFLFGFGLILFVLE